MIVFFKSRGKRHGHASSSIAAFLVLTLFFGFNARALTIRLDTIAAHPGDSITIPITTKDFISAGSFTLYIQYGTSVLKWGRALNWNPQLLDGIHMANASGGILAVVWADVNGATINDGTIADLRFKFLGGSTPLVFTAQSEVSDLWGNPYTPAPLFGNGLAKQKISIAANIDPRILCEGDTCWLNAIVTGGFGNTQYLWSSVPAGFTSTLANPFDVPDSSCLYQIVVTDGFDTAAANLAVTVFHNIAPGVVNSMFPAQGSTSLPLPLLMSWNVTSYTSHYDLYIWPQGSPEPGTPTVAGLEQINYLADDILDYGIAYNWRVVSNNPCTNTSGPLQTFSVRHLPDLVVKDIEGPAQAYSGLPLSINFEVKNQGLGSTLYGQWTESVYLSSDTILNANTDYFLGVLNNLTYLDSNDSYVQAATFNVPQGITGNYYLFVWTDKTNLIPESNDYNNMSRIENPIPVYLTPTPDLQVSEIYSLQNTFSGQEMNISWKVVNNGLVSTAVSEWYDRVYLSADTFLLADDFNLGTYKHSAYLGPDSTYTVWQTVEIPEYIYGRHYLIIVTDIYNGVYEHALESNNTSYGDSLYVILTPPPDLAVTSVTMPDSLNNKELITVNYTVTNLGANPAIGSWDDALYISGSSLFNSQTATALGYRHYSQGPLAPDSCYTVSKSVRIPKSIYGQQYIYVYSDYKKKVFEHIFEENNIGRSEHSGIVRNPDIEILQLDVPDTLWSGIGFSGSYRVVNRGPGHLLTYWGDATWSDDLYISADSVFNESTAVFLKGLTHPGAEMNSGDSILFDISATLPYVISGTQYIHIIGDADTTIFEGNHEDNNNIVSHPVQVNLSPWPDLVVDQINLSDDTATAGFPFQVSFSVKNQGIGVTLTSAWNDHVYLSANPFSPVNAKPLRKLIVGHSLLPDSSYLSQVYVTLPSGTAEGFYYLWIKTDDQGNVWEYTAEDNNFTRSGPVYIQAYPPVDLVCTVFSAQLTAGSGNPFSFSWTVNNQGLVSTTEYKWEDHLFLANDTQWNPVSDILIGFIERLGNLEPGASYSKTANLNIPNGISGDFYLFIYADRNDVNNDAVPYNNRRYLKDEDGNYLLVHVDFTPPPDLFPAAFDAASSLIAGQPNTMYLKVKNQGTGPVVAASWYDYVFLSDDFLPDGGDIVLAKLTRHSPLAAGDSLADTISATIPATFTGNSLLIAACDKSDMVYEHGMESNNLVIRPVTVIQPPPCDLVVTSVIPPMNVTIGDQVTLSWVVQNTGENPASGLMNEKIYFSADTVWDMGDLLFGSLTDNISLGNGSTITHTLSGTINSIPLGSYYFIVRTDILNNIVELDEDNNTTYSDQATWVDVPELLMNTWLNATLTNNIPQYYRIEIPPYLGGESMLLLLKGDSVYGNNEIFLRFDNTPSRSIYDYAYSHPGYGNQEIIVPSLIPGTWYVMVFGKTLSGDQQPYSLYARMLSFEIISVDANTGGNGGDVTVRLTGSKFSTVMKVSLQKGETMIDAKSMNFINQSLVYLTFQLEGADTGLYNVVAQKFCEGMAILSDGFHVVPASKPELMVDMRCQASVSPGLVGIVYVEYQNTGNTDLVIPLVEFISAEGAPISFDIAGLSSKQTSLWLSFAELNGPAGILRPGAGGTITVYARATVGLAYIIKLPDFE